MCYNLQAIHNFVQLCNRVPSYSNYSYCSNTSFTRSRWLDETSQLDVCSTFARRLFDVCSMFARSCKRGISLT